MPRLGIWFGDIFKKADSLHVFNRTNNKKLITKATKYLRILIEIITLGAQHGATPKLIILLSTDVKYILLTEGPML